MEKIHKFSIEVPVSIEHSKLLDANNENAIAKGMYQVLVYFKILEYGQALSQLVISYFM